MESMQTKFIIHFASLRLLHLKEIAEVRSLRIDYTHTIAPLNRSVAEALS